MKMNDLSEKNVFLPLKDFATNEGSLTFRARIPCTNQTKGYKCLQSVKKNADKDRNNGQGKPSL